MEQRRKAVSVIVPVYNVEKYLKECMDSVVSQTLKNIEIICVNDGSTDGSLEILNRYARRDERVKVISRKNSGYGSTMNVGLDHASGEYIAIVESDDYVEKDMFEKLYQTASYFNAEIVKSDHYIFSTRQGRTDSEYQAACPSQFYNRILNRELCPEIFNFAMMNWTGIYSKKFIDENKIRHNETPGASFQDNGFWFQTMALGKKIVFINQAFYYYRQDNPNSSINSKEKVFCICDEYEYIRNLISGQKKLDKTCFTSYFKKKVFNYLHSYHRIADEYKVEFLRRAAEEFSRDLKEPDLDRSSIGPWLYSIVNRIIDSPELFYIEDSQWTLKKEYEEVHAKLIAVRDSKEFQKGLKIKRIFRQK